MGAAPARDHPDARPALPDVLAFMQLLWAVAHGLEQRSKRMSREAGVTGPQRLVLRVVGLFPGLSAGELAAILHVHPSTLTGVLRRLAAQRLLVRVDDPRDRRRAVLRLSSRGARVNRLNRGTVEAAISEALDGVSGPERLAAMRVLARVAQHLERHAPPRESPRRPRAARQGEGDQPDA
ncbi:MAG TPA: MarR family winged helix-turn-helix transcriptional regulator [Vicinamibacterales bacterium]|nr:MarR family winged helix-turn-helix transcriptional regulator [Vicinamibacterales bacterium]